MPGLDPGIQVLLFFLAGKTWMAGTSPATTTEIIYPDHSPLFLLHPQHRLQCAVTELGDGGM